MESIWNKYQFIEQFLDYTPASIFVASIPEATYLRNERSIS